MMSRSRGRPSRSTTQSCEQSLDLEAELFKGGACTGLIGRHHRGHLLESAQLAE